MNQSTFNQLFGVAQETVSNSPKEIPINWTIVIFCIIISIVFLVVYYTNRKYPKERKEPDPLLKGLIISFLFCATIVIIDVMLSGYSQREPLSVKYWWLYLVILAIVTIYYMGISLKRKPKPFAKQVDALEKYCNQIWDAKFNYSSRHTFNWLVFHKPKERPGEYNEFQQFLLNLTGSASNTVFALLCEINIYTLQPGQAIRNPSLKKINESMGGDAKEVYGKWLNEMSGEDPGIDEQEGYKK